MAKLEDLRICAKCSNVYSNKAGLSIIEKCPICKSGSREKINLD
jgi:phage FluMu protein Com